MNRPAVDSQRIVAATLKTDEAPVSRYDDPGVCRVLFTEAGEPASLVLACPGCGEVSGMSVAVLHKPDVQPSWVITAGERADPRTWTLTPSINCVGCCGWHGFLVRGVFQLTPN